MKLAQGSGDEKVIWGRVAASVKQKGACAYRHAHEGLLRLDDFALLARHIGGCDKRMGREEMC